LKESDLMFIGGGIDEICKSEFCALAIVGVYGELLEKVKKSFYLSF
jgi:hypothetical protein